MNAEEMRGQALACQDRDKEEVPVKSWDMTVWVWQMAIENRDKFDIWNAESRVKDDYTAFRVRLVIETVCDESGTPLFTLEDADALKKRGSAIRMLSNVALRLNKMRQEDLEEGEKNSVSATAGSSPSA